MSLVGWLPVSLCFPRAPSLFLQFPLELLIWMRTCLLHLPELSHFTHETPKVTESVVKLGLQATSFGFLSSTFSVAFWMFIIYERLVIWEATWEDERECQICHVCLWKVRELHTPICFPSVSPWGCTAVAPVRALVAPGCSWVMFLRWQWVWEETGRGDKLPWSQGNHCFCSVSLNRCTLEMFLLIKIKKVIPFLRESHLNIASSDYSNFFLVKISLLSHITS